ncbi:MAG: hypothetical protein FRX48_09182 [Lasallia pustulata]|uniref:Uncharacterized protein n=1 Tax=Lasallia pustulata TaxID=136370 RepID=A0A5M8PDP7_9LECA|nr:MAG: hypothetical protein FRX48_09182 [Lasallia pustulata]
MGLLAAESTSTATLISPIRTVGLYQSDVQHLYLPADVCATACSHGSLAPMSIWAARGRRPFESGPPGLVMPIVE